MKIYLSPEDDATLVLLAQQAKTDNEKEFVEKMRYKMTEEPTWSNDLLVSELDNEDGLYWVRCIDHEFIIGRCFGDKLYEEFYAMNFTEALTTDLFMFDISKETPTLLDWLRKHDFRVIDYNHNYDLI